MRKCKYNAGDILGEYHNILIERTYKDRNSHWHGNFICGRCGKIFDGIISSIAIGTVKTCGCLHEDCCRKLGEQQLQDLVGQKFNHLTAIYRLPHHNRETVFYMCRCDCGNPKLIKVSASNLKHGAVSSCGCALAESIRKDRCLQRIGKRYSKLVVTGLLPYDVNKPGAYYTCHCDCGKDCVISGRNLTSGVASCGCLISKGEEKIDKLLRSMGFSFVRQKSFDTCINPDTGNKLYFDFYLTKEKILIEYDGEQHFRPGGANTFFTEQKVAQIQLRDSIKDEWCKQHHIPLIRIPYTKYDELNEKYLLSLLMGKFG